MASPIAKQSVRPEPDLPRGICPEPGSNALSRPSGTPEKRLPRRVSRARSRRGSGWSCAVTPDTGRSASLKKVERSTSATRFGRGPQTPSLTNDFARSSKRLRGWLGPSSKGVEADELVPSTRCRGYYSSPGARNGAGYQTHGCAPAPWRQSGPRHSTLVAHSALEHVGDVARVDEDRDIRGRVT
jgi:hypothetical protein